MFVYSCPELYQEQMRPGGVKTIKQPKEVVFYHYHGLHSEGRSLIHGWFLRAWRTWQDSNEQEVFEPFIFLWFAFNSWGTCITECDRDADIMDALAANKEMNDEFDRLVNSHNSLVSANAEKLNDLMPIFDAKSLSRTGTLRFNDEESRDQRVTYYLNSGATKFEPKCWKRHKNSGEDVPLDWAHTLKTIYKVRCNLFHGMKMAHSEMDRQIVAASFLTLFHFLNNGGFITA